MSAYVPIFGRGLLIVGLVSLNTIQLARGHVAGAVMVSGLISLVWWENARLSARSEVPGARWAYALGAATGTALACLW